jgi:hypothetical protein
MGGKPTIDCLLVAKIQILPGDGEQIRAAPVLQQPT